MPVVARRLGVWLRAAASLAGMVALVVGVPWLLLATVGNPAPGDGWSWSEPLTNDAILGLVAVLAWLFWGQMLVCLVIEVVAELRIAAGRSADWMTRVPGTFGTQQDLARLLVQAVVAVGMGTGATLAAASASGAQAHATSIVQPSSEALLAETTGPAAAKPPPPRHDVDRPRDGHSERTRTVEVARGDTLWSIAERHLGAGERWRHIADLNHGRIMADGERFERASSIRPGWQLLIPSPSPSTGATRTSDVTVAPGDTLWGLAEQAYGDGEDWRLIYRANRDQITHPDLIHPGQALEIPHDRPALTGKATPSTPPAPPAHPSPPASPPPVPTPPSSPAGPAKTRMPPEADQVAGTDDTADRRTDGSDIDMNLFAALAGGGTLLASGVLVAFLARRRRQFRHRRSGRTITPTPPVLVPAERNVRAVGSAGGAAADFLDRALRDLSRRLAEGSQSLPEVVAARLSDDRLDLLFVAPAPASAPSPWTAADDGRRWSLSRQTAPPATDRLAPYPTLVAVGVDDDGATWLLDLEAARLLQLRGNPTSCENLARFIAAELAVNAWSDDIDVMVAGFAAEVVGLNVSRVRHEGHVDVEGLVKARRRMREAVGTSGLGVLQGRLNGRGGDTWMPKVTVAAVAGQPRAGEALASFLDDVAPDKRRDPVAVVAVGSDTPIDGAFVVTVKDDRTLTLLPWDVHLTANQLTETDARAVADLLSAADQEADAAMPPASGPEPQDDMSDAAGAVRAELTEARGDDPGKDSILPQPNEQYLSTAATTTPDLDALAPRVPEHTRTRLLQLDTSLDDDVAAWYAEDTSRPRLRLLGPVEVRAAGERTTDVDRRLAYYTEVVAYLASRDHGATPEQLAEAFRVQTNTIHSRVGTVRKWLGADPDTADWYLPESTLSPSAKARGVPVYELVGLVSDADLFKRLRHRAQALGADGIDDLITALRLVDGAPYDQLRPGGYGWLADIPLDHYLAAGIVDVAHIVATHALESSDPELARWASAKAIAAAPSEDKPRLDLAQALTVLSRADDADRYLESAVLNRSDDNEPPPGLSPRTIDITGRRLT